MLLLGLGGLLGGALLSNGILLLALGNGLSSLLILKLGSAFGSTPRLSGLLVGTARIAC